MKLLGVCLLFVHHTYAAFDEPVDLGYGFDANTIYWPGNPKFNLSEVERKENPYTLSLKFDAAEHGGTHLDAPLHFNPNGWSVAEIPLDRLIVPGVVFDMQKAAANNSNAEVSVEDLEQWEKDFGPLPCPVTVLFNFGWASKYNNKTEYFGIISSDENELHFPGLSKEAAEWLVNTTKVVGVGVDTASIDPGNSKEFMAHQILTAANIYLMENIDLADKNLPPRDFQLTVMPMKIINGTGAPLRIIASPSEISFISKVLAWFLSIWALMTGLFY